VRLCGRCRLDGGAVRCQPAWPASLCRGLTNCPRSNAGKWRQGRAQLVAAEQSGWGGAHPFLWGGASGNRQIVHGLPGDGLALTFHFPAGVGDGVYAKLIGRPGLAAIVTLDRELCRVLSVQFVNRP
jgi:hypothetical protein